MVNLVEWEVSIAAVRMVVVSALSIVALALLEEMTLLMGALLHTFLKFRKPDTGLHFGL